MKLKDKLQKVWENKALIAEGFYNEYISSDKGIKDEIERRRAICRGCEYYDGTGTKEIIVVKGQPGCLLCGCNITMLSASMAAQCSTPKIGLKARWEPLLTEEQEKHIQEIQYHNQFKKPNQ